MAQTSLADAQQHGTQYVELSQLTLRLLISSIFMNAQYELTERGFDVLPNFRALFVLAWFSFGNLRFQCVVSTAAVIHLLITTHSYTYLGKVTAAAWICLLRTCL